MINRRTDILHIMTVSQSLGFLRGQPSFMAKRGLSSMAISSPGKKLVEFGIEENVPVAQVPMSRRLDPVGDLWSLVKLRKIIINVRPRLVHSHTPKGGLLGMIASWLCCVRHRIYSIHGFPFMTAYGWKRQILRMSERVSCCLAHRVICVSHSIRTVAIQEGLCPAQKIVVFAWGSTNGVDAERRFNPERFTSDQRSRQRAALSLTAEAIVIGFIGRVVRDKGIVELAEAWRRLREGRPMVHLVLVGENEDLDPVPSEAMSCLRSDPKVHFTGPVPDTTLYYSIFDMLVLPTYREGLPNVPLEAAAMGLPVVATRIPGCVDAVVDGVTGTLVPVRDGLALADALERYIDDGELRRRHGAAGRTWVLKHFRPETIWENLLQEYSRVFNRNARKCAER
jgi:glycosyltransferase involved in cell wall biosynthesis